MLPLISVQSDVVAVGRHLKRHCLKSKSARHNPIPNPHKYAPIQRLRSKRKETVFDGVGVGNFDVKTRGCDLGILVDVLDRKSGLS